MKIIQNYVNSVLSGRQDIWDHFRNEKICICTSQRAFLRPPEDVCANIAVGENVSFDVVILAIAEQKRQIRLNFRLNEFSQLRCLILAEGCEELNVTIFVELDGEHSSSEVKNFFIGENFDKQVFSLSQVHNAKSAVSNTISKVVLDDSSIAEFHGNITIAEAATNSDANQRSDSILLSGEAKATSCPNLNIQNNAVKCSHGATVGTIDRSAVFYMMSRGVDEQSCKRLIMEGELAAIINS
ncbi:MAG: SufD family Fe-S cluster assembly protein [Puniceicoccales bacterium]|jgi:Fe-S cluster assembly protein SufD|nr:SufD family Fe-S cluster assembly protein [Puniceicoccales bacterium]